MSKRSDSIRSMFAARPADELTAVNREPASRVSSGSIRSMKETFSGFERENEILREKLASGVTVVEIDPSLIDPSPVADRFPDADMASLDALKASIEQRGQEIPVLVREHPSAPGRYQSAYGHRRIRIARELGRQVKALVRVLSDEDLVVAQGVENSARQDLTFIERAIFALRLEDAGHDRRVVQEALSIEKAEASRLVAVSRAIPGDVVDCVGRAPKIGRNRWQALADALKDKEALARVRTAMGLKTFAGKDSDARFLQLLSAARAVPRSSEPQTTKQTATSASGRKIARLVQSDREVKIVVEQGLGASFGSYLLTQLPGLFEAYVQTQKSQNDEDSI